MILEFCFPMLRWMQRAHRRLMLLSMRGFSDAQLADAACAPTQVQRRHVRRPQNVAMVWTMTVMGSSMTTVRGRASARVSAAAFAMRFIAPGP